MLPENIDDLFRSKLDGHPTPPGDALWARLQAQPAAAPGPETDAEANRLDELFQARLNAHATPPSRAVWERLEDEHLRPRKRRAAAWWPLALAAVIALLLVAGGVNFWSGRSVGPGAAGTVASQRTGRSAAPAVSAPAAAEQPLRVDLTPTPKAVGPNAAPAAVVASTTQATSNTVIQKNAGLQATRSGAVASTAPKASAGQSPSRLAGTNRQPDAATGQRLRVARNAPRPAPTRRAVADEPPRTSPNSTTVALAPQPAPTPEIVRTAPAPTPAVAAASELISVDVRSGGAAPARPAKTSLSAVAEFSEPAQRRSFGGRLLKQAGNLARGERVSLAEVTGLPENVTLRATIGGRDISKSIRL